MREIEVSRLTEVIEKLCIEANEHLPEDVKDAIKTCRACEDGEIAKGVLDNIIENFDIADSENVPICQDTGMACRWFEHTDLAHVLASEAFWSYCYFHLISGNDLCIDHSRCIVTCISTAYRIFYNRFAKVAVCISAANAFIDGVGKVSANKVYILPISIHIYKNKFANFFIEDLCNSYFMPLRAKRKYSFGT